MYNENTLIDRCTSIFCCTPGQIHYGLPPMELHTMRKWYEGLGNKAGQLVCCLHVGWAAMPNNPMFPINAKINKLIRCY